MGFFVGGDDEQIVMDVHDVPVTALEHGGGPGERDGRDGRGEKAAGTKEKAEVVEHGGDDGNPRSAAPVAVLPPVEFHLGDALEVCREGGTVAEVDFDYMTSQMTQGPTQDPGICLQSLVKQNSRPIGVLAAAKQGVSLASPPSGPHAMPLSDLRVMPPPSTTMPMPVAAGGSIFQTGSGATIRVDPERLAASRRMLDESGGARGAIASPAPRGGGGTGTGTGTGTGGSIFSTGAGGAISIDPQRLAASRRMLGESPGGGHVERRASGSNASGAGVTMGTMGGTGGTVPQAKATTGSIFSTGAGGSIAIDPEKLAASRRMLDDTGGAKGAMGAKGAKGAMASPAPRPQAGGGPGSIFSTGAGGAISIDPERLAASRRMLEPLGSGAKPVAAGTPVPQGVNDKDKDKGGGSIFQTGAGSAIKISKEKLDASKRLLDDGPASADRKASTPMSRFAPNRAEQKNFPGQPDLLRRQRPMSAAGNTPRMMTPQNTFGGGALKAGNNLITPGSSIAGSANRLGPSGYPMSGLAGSKRHRFAHDEHDQSCSEQAQFDRRELPVTPKMAAKFAFSGMYGPGDVRAHLLSAGAIPEVVSDAWVRNHYKWIVWKLALLELYAESQAQIRHHCNPDRAAPDELRLGTHLNYEAVKEELSMRYTKEYVEGKRSYLKGVLQRDVPFGVPCVLKVAAVVINTASSSTASRTPNANRTPNAKPNHVTTTTPTPTCTLELTDGWYSIYADCDRDLLAVAQSRKLYVGQKVRIFGAALTSGSPGDPLEVVNETRIVLAYNQVHPVPPGTRLGAQPDSRPITPLSCINDKGGKVPRTVVSVLRVFAPMVWSKLPSGVETFQTAGKAGKAEAALEGELERIFSQVKSEIEQEDLKMCKSWLDEGKAGGIKHVQRLYAKMMVSGDDQFAEGLNTQDKIDLQEFLMEHNAEMDDERKSRVREVLGAEVPAASDVKTTPCRTLLVGEVSYGSSEFVGRVFKQPMEYLRPDDYPSVSLLTVWDRDVAFREGDVISVSAVESFDRRHRDASQAHQGPFLGALKHLKTTKMSEIEVLPADCVPPERIVRSARSPKPDGDGGSRFMTTEALIRARDRGSMIPNVFDVDAVVALTSPVLLEDSCYYRQWVFAIDHVEEVDGHAHPWVLAIKLSGPQDAIKWFEPHAGGFVSHFGNVSLMAFDVEQRFVQLQGSMGTDLGADVASGSHVKSLLGEEALLESLKTRLSGLVG